MFPVLAKHTHFQTILACQSTLKLTCSNFLFSGGGPPGPRFWEGFGEGGNGRGREDKGQGKGWREGKDKERAEK